MSVVVTVYNKASCLPWTIRSLRRQMADEGRVEYIFVDDASSDGSIEVIRRDMTGAPHLQVIANTVNRGPSIRINQGGQAASGTYLYFLDADDIAVDGAMTGMLRLLQRERADLIYGKTEKRQEPPAKLLDMRVDPAATHVVSDRPLAYIMKGGFVRMALMCKRELFLRAGGADERIFIQDESLPLRLCARAARFVDWRATVVSVPATHWDSSDNQAVSHISGDKTQLHHDAFFAHLNALEATRDTHPELAPKLYARAISSYWKYLRRQSRHGWLTPGFWRYLEAKWLRPAPRPDVLRWMEAEFLAVPNIRRVEKQAYGQDGSTGHPSGTSFFAIDRP